MTISPQLSLYSTIVRTVPEVGRDLGVAVIRAEDARPLRPWVVATAGHRGLGQQLEVCDGLRAVAHGGTDTVVARVATTNDDDVLALRVDVATVLQLRVEQRLGVELEVLHREVDAVNLTVGDLEIARPCGTSSEDDCIVLIAELAGGDILADEGIRDESLDKFNR